MQTDLQGPQTGPAPRWGWDRGRKYQGGNWEIYRVDGDDGFTVYTNVKRIRFKLWFIVY